MLIGCVDGLKGFPEAIEAVFPQAWVQTCIVHLIRSSMRWVSYSDRKKVAAELRPIYAAVNAEAAEHAARAFDEKWGARYPVIAEAWRDAWEYITPFLALPAELRRIVYTTDESVKGSRGGADAVCEGSDRSGEVLAGAQIGSCGRVLGWIARNGPVSGMRRLRRRSRRASARRSAGVRLRCGRGRPPSEAQDLGLSPAAQLLPRLRALRVAPHWRRPRPMSSSRRLGLPVGDQLAIGLFGLLVERVLARADLFERVAGGLALLPAAGRQAGAELEARSFWAVSDGRAKA